MNNQYRIIPASALRLLEIAVEAAMRDGWQPQGSPSGNMGQGYMQAVVRENKDAPEQSTDNQ